MSETTDQPVRAEEDAPAGDSNGTSILDGLRAQHKKLSESKTIDLPVPGYEGYLVARYRVLDFSTEIGAIAKRVAKSHPTALEGQVVATIDALVTSCTELLVDKDGDGKLQPLSRALGPEEPPVCYDERLAQIMNWEGVATARDVVRRLFNNNESMIMDHGQKLSRWMSDTTRGVNEDFFNEIQ